MTDHDPDRKNTRTTPARVKDSNRQLSGEAAAAAAAMKRRQATPLLKPPHRPLRRMWFDGHKLRFEE
jgi:hypothetical protein